MPWTNDQQNVIDSRGKDLLVAAAAGSGKTAVLIERILRIVLDPEHPVDIDHLLVVTFTRAAAAQMRERVRTALEKKLDENPADPRPMRQLSLLPNARITTIDGFCSYVLRNYGSLIGLESGFRVANEGEVKLLRSDIIKALFEEEHAQGTPSFRNFIETFAPGRSTKAPGEMLLALYDTAFSSPAPERWLSEAITPADDISWENADCIPWMKMYLKDIGKLLEQGHFHTQENIALVQRPDGPSAYTPVATAENDLFEALLSVKGDYAALRKIITSYSAPRLSTAKPKAGEDPSLRDTFKNTRDEIKDIYESLRGEYLLYDPDTALYGQRCSYEALAELIRLTRLFYERFSASKREKNLLDYNDLEQLALKVLTEEDGTPSKAAKELAERYRYVMIDEYQDSNYLQEALLTAVAGNGGKDHNYFMVGDVKQSIYSFRQARPDLFMEKYDRGTTDRDQRIDLHANFRSRPEVLDSVNDIFSQIMRREVGGIDYDDAARLVFGDSTLYPAPPSGEKTDYQTEYMLVSPPLTPEGKDPDPRVKLEAEALAVADRIRALTKETYIYDKEEKTYRLTEYRDIVVLLRSLDDYAEILQETLRLRDIPVYTTQRTGYFTAQEVQAVLSYLAILDNPQQDIPLAAVLRSPFVRLGAKDLALIRIFADQQEDYRGASFWNCVRLYAEKGENIRLKDTLAAFALQFAEYRRSARHLMIHELIFRIISETGFADYVRALPGGMIRSGNLEMLITMAMDYEKTSYAGLYHFIRYINSLKEYKIDTGEAAAASEGENAVRIMTIHSSKGLEFPVVILSRMDKQFNRQDLNRSVLIHPSFGIASDYVRLEDRVRIKTPARSAIRRRLASDANGEELRILYVAMTRAEQKLIMTGVMKNSDALEKKRLPADYDDGYLPVSSIENASSFADFVLPAALRLSDLAAPGEIPSVRFDFVDTSAIRENTEKKASQEALLFEKMKQVDLSVTYDATLHERLMARFGFHYPYEGLDRMPAKISVSELKTARYYDEEAFRTYEEPEVIPLIPDFMKDSPEELTGAGRGTVYHKFMELLDYRAVMSGISASAATSVDAQSDATASGAAQPVATASVAADLGTAIDMETLCKAVSLEIMRLKNAGLLSPEEAAVLQPSDMAIFLTSEIGKRMAAAALRGQLFRETPFTYSVPADSIDPAFPSSETILVQGVVDAWFMEGGKIILVDYKTDYVPSGDGEELVRKYKAQLISYADALERLTGLPVTERFIYSFYLGKSIAVPNSPL